MFCFIWQKLFLSCENAASYNSGPVTPSIDNVALRLHADSTDLNSVTDSSRVKKQPQVLSAHPGRA